MNIAVLSCKGKTGKTTIAKFLQGFYKSAISSTEMKIASGGLGKLTNYLRENGREFSYDEPLIINDVLKGTESALVSSITRSDAVLIVTEPSKSGLEDLMRIVALCEHFGVFTMVCINKFDIAESISEEIEKFIEKEDLILVGKIPYDSALTKTINYESLITYEDNRVFSAIKKMWENIKAYI